MLGRKRAGRAMQVARAAIVAEALPEVEDFRLIGRGQGGNVWQGSEKALEVRDNSSDLRLLQHHLADPDAIRVATCPLRRARAPGKITSVHAKPLQQTALQGAALLMPSFGCPLDQATLYSHELELRNRIPYNMVRRRVLTEHKRLGCVQFRNGCRLRIYGNLYFLG